MPSGPDLPRPAPAARSDDRRTDLSLDPLAYSQPDRFAGEGFPRTRADAVEPHVPEIVPEMFVEIGYWIPVEPLVPEIAPEILEKTVPKVTDSLFVTLLFRLLVGAPPRSFDFGRLVGFPLKLDFGLLLGPRGLERSWSVPVEHGGP